MDREQAAPTHECESSERYTSLFTHHPHASYSVDRDGYYTDANARALAMTGLSLDEMKGTHFSQVVHPEDIPILQAQFERALAGEGGLFEARVVHAGGQVVDIRCTVIPVVVGGEVIGVHGVTEDITEAKQLVRELEETNARLEETSAAKNLFLANVSHEVRTPLTSILAASELLAADPLDDDAAGLIDIVNRNGTRLLTLMNEILDFSQLEAHRVVLRAKPFGVFDIVEGVAEWAVPFARDRDLSLSINVDDSVPKILVGDGPRVAQVVTNLVQNALKFTEHGSVDVHVRHRAATPGPCADRDAWVEFTVTDTGIGITEDRLPDLFEPFTQDNPADTRSYRGIGLGLALCRDLVNLMGGRLHASSEVGVGSVFTFSVPVSADVSRSLTDGLSRPRQIRV